MKRADTYSLKIDARPKYVTEDAQNRVYISLVRVKRKPPDWRPFLKKALRKSTWLWAAALRLLIAFAVAFGTALVFFHIAYTERGYSAVGGEYLLVAGVFFFTHWLLGKIPGPASGKEKE